MAFLFEDDSGQVITTSDFEMDTSDDFTFMIWALAQSVGGDGDPFEGGMLCSIAGAGGFLVFRMPADTGAGNESLDVVYDFGSGEDEFGSGAGSVILGEWAHWAVRYTDSTHLMEILKNGSVVASDTNDVGAGGNMDFLAVGAGDDPATESEWDGVLADFRFYRGNVLTDNEVTGAMEGMHPRRAIAGSQGLWVWWQMLAEGDGVNEPDLSGEGFVGEIRNAPEVFNHPSILSSRLRFTRTPPQLFLAVPSVYQQAVSRFRNDNGDLTAPL